MSQTEPVDTIVLITSSHVINIWLLLGVFVILHGSKINKQA